MIAKDGKFYISVTVGADPIGYADAVIVARNGKMYVSDASTRFAPASWGGAFEASVFDIVDQSPTGRILEYDPAIQATHIVAHGMGFTKPRNPAANTLEAISLAA